MEATISFSAYDAAWLRDWDVTLFSSGLGLPLTNAVSEQENRKCSSEP